MSPSTETASSSSSSDGSNDVEIGDIVSVCDERRAAPESLAAPDAARCERGPTSAARRAAQARAVAPLRGHPVLFSGAFLDALPTALAFGAEIEIRDARNNFVGKALATGDKALRIVTREDEPIDGAFFRKRLVAALHRRCAMFGADEALRATRALRIVAADNDELPFVVVDRYADACAVQLGPFRGTRFEPLIVDAVADVTGCARLVARAANSAGAKPSAADAWLRGGSGADACTVEIVEHGLRYRVDLVHGQKTGFYLDQAENRLAFRQLVAQRHSRRVLDLCSFTGQVFLGRCCRCAACAAR